LSNPWLSRIVSDVKKAKSGQTVSTPQPSQVQREVAREVKPPTTPTKIVIQKVKDTSKVQSSDMSTSEKDVAYKQIISQPVFIKPVKPEQTIFTRNEAIREVQTDINRLTATKKNIQSVQDTLKQNQASIKPGYIYETSIAGNKVNLSSSATRTHLFMSGILAKRNERLVDKSIRDAQRFKNTLREQEKYGTTVSKTDSGWDISFDPKKWEAAEDARARRDWDFGYLIGKPISRFLSRGDYTMESLRSGYYTPESGLVIGGEKLDPLKMGSDSRILSKAHYDYYKLDWGGRFAKGITSEPVMLVVTAGAGAGVSAVGYTALGAKTVGTVGSRTITGSNLLRTGVTAGFVGMGAYGTVTTYQQGGMKAVEEQVKRAGVMSPLFIGAYQTGYGYGGQLAYKGWQTSQRLGIPSHPLRTGWSNIGKFTPTPVKNIYSKYSLAKADVVNQARMARMGSNWEPGLLQKVSNPIKSTSYRIGQAVKPKLASGWNKFRYYTMESTWRDYTLSKRMNQYGGTGARDFYTGKAESANSYSGNWKPMASQREVMTSWEQIRGKRPDSFTNYMSSNKWGAYSTSWKAYDTLALDFRYSLAPPKTSLFPSNEFLKPRGEYYIKLTPSSVSKMKFYSSIDDIGLPSKELDTRTLGGYNQTTTNVYKTVGKYKPQSSQSYIQTSYSQPSINPFTSTNYPYTRFVFSGGGYSIAHGAGISLNYLNWLEEGIDQGVHSHWSSKNKNISASFFNINYKIEPAVGFKSGMLPININSYSNSLSPISDIGIISINKTSSGLLPDIDTGYSYDYASKLEQDMAQSQKLDYKSYIKLNTINSFNTNYSNYFPSFDLNTKPSITKIKTPIIPDFDKGYSKSFKLSSLKGWGKGYRFRDWNTISLKDFIGGK